MIRDLDWVSEHLSKKNKNIFVNIFFENKYVKYVRFRDILIF